MWECNYSREPVNYRLMWLKLLKKIWLIPASAVLGAAVVFGVYFLYKTVITGRTYQVENIYYIDFAEDSSGKQYDWVNQYTWSQLADMDVFIEGIYADLNGEVSKEALRAYSDCTIEADGRYLYMRITTPTPELSEKVAASYERTLFAFCDEHKEFNDIKCEHKGEATENSNIRVAAVSIIGAVIGLVCCLIIMVLCECMDTSVYIPATLEYRYHVPTLGCVSMKEYEENCRHFLQGKKTAVVFVDEVTEVSLYGAGEAVSLANPCENPSGLRNIEGCEAVVVAVEAGAHNGKKLERVIEELSRLEIKIDAFLLTKEDESLIKQYYRM